MPLITLLTDFGLQDEYVGVMKGVIAGIHGQARIVDISHHIEPQNVMHGAFILAAAHAFFPPGTIHVAVVDPGVGSGRRILAVEAGGHHFLAPDNGLLERVLAEKSDVKAVAIENQDFFLHPVSQTFHGRDIFAPVAAHLSRGTPMDKLGPAIAHGSMVAGVVPSCQFVSESRIDGVVVAVDRFGNLLTSIEASFLETLQGRFPGAMIHVQVSSVNILGLASAYQKANKGALLAIVGSRGLLEISVNLGSAHKALGVGQNEAVRVTISSEPLKSWKPVGNT